MKRISLFLLLFTGAQVNAQNITVIDTEIKVSTPEVLYFGFEAGDKIVFTMDVSEGKEMREVTINEYPDREVFSAYKETSLNKTLTVSTKGIYQFRFTSGAFRTRYARIKIERIPASSATRNFNTQIEWRTVTDTTWYTVQEQYVVKADTFIQELTDTDISLQKYAPNFPYKTVKRVVLPENTEYWSYYVGVGNAGDLAYELSATKLLMEHPDTILKYNGYTPLTAVGLGHPPYIEPMRGSDVQLYLLGNETDEVNYKANQPYNKYHDNVGEVFFARRSSPKSGTVYIAMENRNACKAVTLKLKVQAVQVVREYATREIEKFRTNSYKKPFHVE